MGLAWRVRGRGRWAGLWVSEGGVTRLSSGRQGAGSRAWPPYSQGVWSYVLSWETVDGAACLAPEKHGEGGAMLASGCSLEPWRWPRRIRVWGQEADPESHGAGSRGLPGESGGGVAVLAPEGQGASRVGVTGMSEELENRVEGVAQSGPESQGEGSRAWPRRVRKRGRVPCPEESGGSVTGLAQIVRGRGCGRGPGESGAGSHALPRRVRGRYRGVGHER